MLIENDTIVNLLLKVVDIFSISEVQINGDYLFVTRYNNKLSMLYTYNHHLGSNKTTLTKCLVYILCYIDVLLFSYELHVYVIYKLNLTYKNQ